MEARYYQTVYFITLTYNDEHLPEEGLRPEDVTKYLKRLRHHIDFRYYICGEYGERNGRSHYHGIIFTSKETKIKFGKNEKGQTIVSDSVFHMAWKDKDGNPIGFVDVAPLLRDSDQRLAIGYCAGYVLKKLQDESHPEGKTPIFQRMSTNRCIGYKWAKQVALRLAKDKYGDELNQEAEKIINMEMMRYKGFLYPIGRTLKKTIIDEIGKLHETGLSTRKKIRMDMTARCEFRRSLNEEKRQKVEEIQKEREAKAKKTIAYWNRKKRSSGL
jgi:hypothetical protein